MKQVYEARMVRRNGTILHATQMVRPFPPHWVVSVPSDVAIALTSEPPKVRPSLEVRFRYEGPEVDRTGTWLRYSEESSCLAP